MKGQAGGHTSFGTETSVEVRVHLMNELRGGEDVVEDRLRFCNGWER